MRSTISEVMNKMEVLTAKQNLTTALHPKYEIEFCQLAAAVSRMIYAYGDRKNITISWNCMPLLFRSKLDSLFDAKYLAAIRELARYRGKQSDQFAYRACILFQIKISPPSQILNVSNFTSFQKSWHMLQLCHKHFIFPEGLTVEENEPMPNDQGQLKLIFNERF